MRLDTLDIQLLRLLAADARASWADLGVALGLAGTSVADRVRRLQQGGVIRGFSVIADAAALGCGVTAFVAVTLARARDRARFLKQVRATPEVLECHHLAGEDDYLLKVRCLDVRDLERVLTARLRAHAGIARTRTTIALSSVKESALPPPLAPRAPRSRR